MAKQIILTKNDSGILIKAQIKENKQELDLTGCMVEVQIVTPSGTKLPKIQAIILNTTNGTCAIICSKAYTSEVGLYKTYWQVINEYSEVTTQKDLFYYVKDEFGGAI